jgi:hypothetical protein
LLALSLCTDYAAAFVLPAFFVALWVRDRANKEWTMSAIKVVAGALPLAVYFFWYPTDLPASPSGSPVAITFVRLNQVQEDESS